MAKTLEACHRHGVLAGAHPSFPDREGFGRRPQSLPPAELASSLRVQLALFAGVAAKAGVAPHHVKAHGALYHAANRDRSIARILLAVTRDVLGPVRILAPPGGAQAVEAGDALLREGFADRRYGPRGALVARGEARALLHAGEAAAQARRIATRFDTLCVHGDRDDAIEVASAVRVALGPRR